MPSTEEMWSGFCPVSEDCLSVEDGRFRDGPPFARG